MYIDKAIEEMKLLFKDFPWGIEHSLHVLGYAEAILDGEGISGALRETTALAAVLHDVGIPEAKRKHGSAAGPYQEMEGAPIAQAILERIGPPPASLPECSATPISRDGNGGGWVGVAARVCYIVGHHHTADKIDGVDFQILWEADAIENLLDAQKAGEAGDLRRKVDENFKTATGRKLAIERLGLQGACP